VKLSREEAKISSLLSVCVDVFRHYDVFRHHDREFCLAPLDSHLLSPGGRFARVSDEPAAPENRARSRSHSPLYSYVLSARSGSSFTATISPFLAATVGATNQYLRRGRCALLPSTTRRPKRRLSIAVNVERTICGRMGGTLTPTSLTFWQRSLPDFTV
jgi:hypothetical protein